MSPRGARDESPGKRRMGLVGIMVTSFYLIFFGSSLLFMIIQIWPPTCRKEIPIAPGTPKAPQTTTSTTSSSEPASPGPQAGEGVASSTPAVILDPCKCPGDEDDPAPSRHAGKILWWKGCLWDEDRLLIIVMLAGALGSLVHGLRSLYWYIGNRELVWSWIAMYIMLPFVGATMATVFYLIVRAGFFTPSPNIESTNPFGFAAIAALIGMFTEQAARKLQQVAETLLAKAEKGKDQAALTPTVKQIEPSKGLTVGGEPVKIIGEQFSNVATVTFGGIPATEVKGVDETTINAITPPHKEGMVDVVVTNTDKMSGQLEKGFTYILPEGEAAAGDSSTVEGATEATGGGEAGKTGEGGATTTGEAAGGGTTGAGETLGARTTPSERESK